MWNNAAILGQIASAMLWVAAVSGVLAAVAGFVSGVTANRASTILAEQSAERVAQANARAEEARLETQKLRERVSWRSLSRGQFETLAESLKGEAFEVWTSWVGNDPEATNFRTQLDSALSEAGLKTKFFSGWALAVGLQVIGPASSEKDRLIRAMQAAGLEPIEGKSHPEWFPEDLTIIVGTLPPP